MVTDETHSSAVEQITRIRREIERAENAGDPSFIDEYCTEDAIGIPPGQEPNIGKDAGKANLRDFFATYDFEVEYTSEEIVVGEELAFERLTAHSTRIPKDGGEPIEHTADSLWVYRQSSDGEWKQCRAIWNYRE